MAWIAPINMERLGIESYRMPSSYYDGYEATTSKKFDNTTEDFLLFASTPFLIAIAITALG